MTRFTNQWRIDEVTEKKFKVASIDREGKSPITNPITRNMAFSGDLSRILECLKCEYIQLVPRCYSLACPCLFLRNIYNTYSKIGNDVLSQISLLFTAFRREKQLKKEHCSFCFSHNQFALLSPGSIGKQLFVQTFLPCFAFEHDNLPMRPG